ncbi:hypothetical protein ACOME3_003503 [Neoechinorhynchus agilis]
MKIRFDDLVVYFPFNQIYPEQYMYMSDLKKALDARGHCVLEMPSGTGKTICLLSVTVCYLLNQKRENFDLLSDEIPTYSRIVYCSRTNAEVDKMMAELKRLIEYIEADKDLPRLYDLQAAKFIAMSLCSRKSLCIHPERPVDIEDLADSFCFQMTSPWANEGGCGFYNTLKADEDLGLLTTGVYDFESLKTFSASRGICPYFTARQAVSYAHFIGLTYAYVFDWKVRQTVLGNDEIFGSRAILILDEAHNIDDFCMDSLTVRINEVTLDKATNNLNELESKSTIEVDGNKMLDLCTQFRLVMPSFVNAGAAEGEKGAFEMKGVKRFIKTKSHFILFMRRFIGYLRTRLRINHDMAESSPSFLNDALHKAIIDPKALRKCAERLRDLINECQVEDIHEYKSLFQVVSFGSLASKYERGFNVIVEIAAEKKNKQMSKFVTLLCLDPSIAMEPVLNNFRSVTITSGTLSPISTYVRLLHFQPVLVNSFPATISRRSICPLIITRPSDEIFDAGSSLTCKFESRDDPLVTYQYGVLVAEL